MTNAVCASPIDGAIARRDLAGDLTLLLAWPLLLLLIDFDWAFTPPGSIDPWVYFGTFVNLSYNLTNFGQTYYVGRLSWILPGYLAHALLPPVAATVCLHLAVFYAATIGCYFCVRTTVGRRPALLVAMMLGAYQPFLNAVGWDYVDGAGLAYFVLACACGAVAVHGKRPLMWGSLCGACAAACIFTNLAWLMLMPAFVIYLALLSPSRPLIQHLPLARAIGAGAAAITVACGLVYASITGRFWFFLPSVTVSRALISQPNAWQSQTYLWVWDSALLGTAAAVGLLSLIRLVTLIVRRAPRTSWAPFAIYLSSAFVMLGVQLSGTPVLQFPYYATYLIPGMALATGALLAGPLQHVSSRAWHLMSAIAAAAWLLLVLTHATAAPPAGVISLFSAAMAIAGLTAIVFRASSTRSWPLAAGLACVLALMVVHRGPRAGEPGERQLNLRVTADALELLVPIQTEKPFFFWYSDAAPRGHHGAYLSIASCYLWGYRLFSTNFPARTTPAGAVNQAQAGQRIVLLTERRYAPQEIEDALGAGIRVVKEGHVGRGGLDFNLVVFDVR